MRPCTILLLDSQDSFGNARTTGGDAVTFAVTAPNGEVSMLAQGAGVGQWEDPGDGSYHAVSQFTMSGEYEVDVGVGGVLAGGGDTKAVFVVPAAPCPDCFQADLSGLQRGVAGEPLHFTMEARDAYSNACHLDLGRAKVVLRSEYTPGVQQTEVAGDLIPLRHNAAACEVELICPEAHIYRLETSYDGVPVEVAQMEIKVEPCETLPAKCSLFADTDIPDRRKAAGTTNGLQEAYLGIPAQFYIQARDEYGNPRRQGGDKVRVTCIPDEEPAVPPAGVHLADIGDGTYRVTYLACKVGDHKLSIWVNEVIISKPYRVKVSTGMPQKAPEREKRSSVVEYGLKCGAFE